MPPGAKGSYRRVTPRGSGVESEYEAFYPVIGFESGFTGF